MSETRKKTGMLIFGALLALFMAYGYELTRTAEIFNHFSNNRSVIYAFSYMSKMLLAATLILMVFRKKIASIVCAGVFAFLAFSGAAAIGSGSLRLLGRNWMSLSAGFVFSALLVLSAIFQNHRKLFGIFGWATAGVCFFISVGLTFFSYSGQFIGIDAWVKMFQSYTFRSIMEFFTNLQAVVPSKLNLFPFTVCLNFCVLAAACMISGKKSAQNPGA